MSLDQAKQESAVGIVMDADCCRTAINSSASRMPSSTPDIWEVKEQIKFLMELIRTNPIGSLDIYLRNKLKAKITEYFGDEYSHLKDDEKEAMQAFDEFRRKEG